MHHMKTSTLFEGAKAVEMENGLFQPPAPKKWTHDALLHMGYPSLKDARPEIREMVKEHAPRVLKTAAPKCLHQSEPLADCSASGFSTENLTIKSRKWGRLSSMAGARGRICCFALTLGLESEEIIQALGARSLMTSYVRDALCSTLVEHYACQAEEHVAEFCANQGLSASRRFSPGYCDLDFAEGQKQLFKLMRPEAIGINLSASGLMIPRKSVTCMVLAAESIPERVPCVFRKADCAHRRMGFDAAKASGLQARPAAFGRSK